MHARGVAVARRLLHMHPRFIAISVAALVGVAAQPFATADGSETRGYVTSLGAGALGIGAAGNNAAFGPGTFTSGHLHTRVTVTVVDDSSTDPYTTVCVDLNANNVCTTTDGDIQSSGFGRVSVSAATGFSRVQVYVYAFMATEDAAPHVGTTGTVTVAWG